MIKEWVLMIKICRLRWSFCLIFSSQFNKQKTPLQVVFFLWDKINWNTLGYSVNNSLSSSQNRICEDSGIYSNSMHFPTSSINSEDLECLNNFTSIDYDGEDLLDNSDFELVVRNRCNTWPALHPTEFQTNDSSLMRGNIPEENMWVIWYKVGQLTIFRLYGQNGSQVSIDLRAEEAHIDNQDVQDSHEQDINLKWVVY